MNIELFSAIVSDYRKIYFRDKGAKKELYDTAYAEKMRAFSARPLWRDEAEYALKGVCLPANARALDVGCNNGGGTELLSKSLGVSFDGVDISEPAIAMARTKHPEKAERFHHYDGQHLPFDDQSFEFVSSMHVIGHVASPVDFLREVWRVLKPGGFLRIATPNADYKLFAIVDSFISGYRPDPTVRRYFSSNRLHKTARDAGFTDIACSTFGERPMLLRFLPDGAYGRIRIILKARKPEETFI